MQPCNRINYSTVHWRLNMFRAAYRSSSGALTVFADSGLHTHVVTGRSQVWVDWRLNMFRAAYRSSSGALTVFADSGLHTHVVTGRSQVWVGLRLDYGRSPHAYVNQSLQIQLELLMMGGMQLETCWAFNERWNNKFYYKVESCWLFLLSTLLVFFPPLHLSPVCWRKEPSSCWMLFFPWQSSIHFQVHIFYNLLR